MPSDDMHIQPDPPFRWWNELADVVSLIGLLGAILAVTGDIPLAAGVGLLVVGIIASILREPLFIVLALAVIVAIYVKVRSTCEQLSPLR